MKPSASTRMSRIANAKFGMDTPKRPAMRIKKSGIVLRLREDKIPNGIDINHAITEAVIAN